MKKTKPQAVSGKASKPPEKDITVSISQKKAAGAAAGATLGAIAAGPIGALVGGVVGGLVAANPEKVKKELGAASKAVLKKAPSLHEVEVAAVKAGKKTAVALKGGGAKIKAALVKPKAKAAPKKTAPKKPAKAAPAKAKLSLPPKKSAPKKSKP